MEEIKYQIITTDDIDNIELIADWYLKEWNIPKSTTTNKIKKLSVDNGEFQVLMTKNEEPIATGGIYNHVGLLDREPKFRIYTNWLALVYTKSEFRGNGLGFLICEYIQNHSKEIGLDSLYLFTHTAENLYNRLGWKELERLVLGNKNITIMKKEL
jgi:GNAT superfamily N-acetyltransferase